MDYEIFSHRSIFLIDRQFLLQILQILHFNEMTKIMDGSFVVFYTVRSILEFQKFIRNEWVQARFNDIYSKVFSTPSAFVYLQHSIRIVCLVLCEQMNETAKKVFILSIQIETCTWENYLYLYIYNRRTDNKWNGFPFGTCTFNNVLRTTLNIAPEEVSSSYKTCTHGHEGLANVVCMFSLVCYVEWIGS